MTNPMIGERQQIFFSRRFAKRAEANPQSSIISHQRSTIKKRPAGRFFVTAMNAD